MKWFAETTEWADASTPNGVYLLDDSKSKIYAFKPFGTGKIKTFKNPIKIDVRGRKFTVNGVQFKTSIDEEVPEGRTIEVRGSKGDIYKVTELNGAWSCSCSGFKFRGQCRHIKEAQE